MEQEWEPVLAFSDESESFALGFEAGRIWQSLHNDTEEQTFTIHGRNAELMLRMSESTKRELSWKETTDTRWSEVTFGPAEENSDP